MKKNEGYISGYNAQAVVDSTTQMIICSDVYPRATEAYNGIPLLNKTVDSTGYSKIDDAELCFDSGYLEDRFLKFADDKSFNLYIPPYPVVKATLRKDKDRYVAYDKEQNLFHCKKKKVIKMKRLEYQGHRAVGLYER